MNQDIVLLRDLAKRYMEAATKPIQQERRDLWRLHNSLKRPKPLIYVRAFAWGEMPENRHECEDPFYRPYEDFFRQSLFRDTFGDDYILEPWVTVNASLVTPAGGLWGLPIPWSGRTEPTGSRVWDPPLKEPEDFAKMAEPHHIVDEEKTAEHVARLQDAIGDIVPLSVDRAPAYRMWGGDISTHLAYLRGLEQLMWDMMDRPDWLHEVLAFMRDGILRTHEEAERAGDWRLCDHQNQCLPYAEELEDPAAESAPVKRSQLWYFSASQETTLVGPKLWYEFMFQYQVEIMKHFGLTAYGCCEDLTLKIPYVKSLPNMRRISVALTADVKKCAEQIGTDYILSYRPSPTDMVGYGWDPDRARRIYRESFSYCKDLHVDITLKDVETVQGDPDRVRNWVAVTREVIDEFWPD